MLLKLVGASILLWSGAGISALVCENKGRVLGEIQNFVALFRHLRREIECYRRTIPMALASLPKAVAAGCLGGKGTAEGDLASFIEACPMCARGLSEIVRGAMRELGKGDVGEQLRILDGAESALMALYEKEEKRVRQEQGTARVACMGGAAFAVILLL